ncbi:hypothetical protein CR513_40998, partial [Mucuna pruriens]
MVNLPIVSWDKKENHMEEHLEKVVSLSQEEIERRRAIFSNLEKPSGTCTLAYSCMLPLSFGFNISKALLSLWVLDSRATDHMTPSSKYFSTYSPCPNNKKIATTDGTLVTVVGIGYIQINPSITLKDVLHVPKLSTNLVFVQKLTNDLSCIDKELGRMIGRARERNDLYLLEEPSVPKKKKQSYSCQSL